jgi:hypothetical protein
MYFVDLEIKNTQTRPNGLQWISGNSRRSKFEPLTGRFETFSRRF